MSQWADDPFPFDQEHCLYVERLPIEGNPHVKAGFGVVHNVDEFKEAFSRATGADAVAAKVHGVGDPSGKTFAFVRLPNPQIRDQLLGVGSFALDFLVGQPWKLVVKAPRGTAPPTPNGSKLAFPGPTPLRTYSLAELSTLSEPSKTVAQTPEFRWEFRGSKGDWYRMQNASQLEQAFRRGDVSLLLAPHHIDFKAWKQRNLDTGTERAIRRVQMDRPSTARAGNAQPLIIWEYQDSDGKWKISTDFRKLESAWQQKSPAPVTLSQNRVFDLSTMQQTQQETGKVRKLRRRKFMPRALSWRDPTLHENPELRSALRNMCGVSVSEALMIPDNAAARGASLELVASNLTTAWHGVVLQHYHPGDPQGYVVFAKCDDDIPKCSNGHRLEFRPTKENPDKVCCCEGTCTHASGANDAAKSKELLDHFTRENSLISAALVASGSFPFLTMALDSKPSPLQGQASAETLATIVVWTLTHEKGCGGQSSTRWLSVYGGVVRDLLLGGAHPTDIDVASYSTISLSEQCAAVQTGLDAHYPGQFQVQPSSKTKDCVFAILEVRAKDHNPTWMVELEFVSANTSNQDPIMDMSFNNLALGVAGGAGVGGTPRCELRQKYPGHGGGLLGSVLGALTKVGTAIKPDDGYQLRRRRDKTHPDKGFRLLNVNPDSTMKDSSTQIVRSSLMVLDPLWLDGVKKVVPYILVESSEG